MPIHMGIMCEACRRVHFIATSPAFNLVRRLKKFIFCAADLPAPKRDEFRKDGMHAYRVSEDVFKRGYANDSEHELVQRD